MKPVLLLVPFMAFSIFAHAINADQMTNPLLSSFNTPHGTIPFDQIQPGNFVPAFDSAFAIGRSEIKAIIDNPEVPDFGNTIVTLEFSGEKIDLLSNILFNLNHAETSPAIQALTKEISPRLTEYRNDITLNPDLFARVKKVYEKTDRNTLTGEQARLLENTYKSFVRSGANLTSEAKERYREVTKELSDLSLKFNDNVLAETNAFILHLTDSADLAGLPADAVATAAEEAKNRNLEGWVFTLQYPSYFPFVQYADNRELRKKISLENMQRCMHNNQYDNRDIIKQIVSLRLEVANLLGFPDFASYVLDERMAENPEKVTAFLKELSNAYLPLAKADVEEVTQYAHSIGTDYDLQRWDWSYYSEKLKEARYTYSDEEVRPYFELNRVRDGIFNLAGKLYGLSIKENPQISVYNKDVKAYEVFDEDGSFLAVLYMDFFPRDTKKAGAWMTEFVSQKIKEGNDIRPHVSLVFNFTKPVGDKPSLLTYDEVRTMLHEFGHGLHSMLSNVTYPSLSGTSVYRDFVELPSQIMENWAEQKEWLDEVAVNYQTGEKMPAELLQKILDSRNYNEGYYTCRQLSFGLDDMAWHSLAKPFEGNVEQFEKQAMAPVEFLPPIEGTAMSPSFSHIFAGGYAAGYYGYKWAELLDADAFSLFEQNGIYDKTTAKRFRDCILSKGGTAHPMKLYVDFRGREPTIDALLERSGIKN
jgi:peptidyl-dipeptidase Dcp